MNPHPIAPGQSDGKRTARLFHVGISCTKSTDAQRRRQPWKSKRHGPSWRRAGRGGNAPAGQRSRPAARDAYRQSTGREKGSAGGARIRSRTLPGEWRRRSSSSFRPGRSQWLMYWLVKSEGGRTASRSFRQAETAGPESPNLHPDFRCRAQRDVRAQQPEMPRLVELDVDPNGCCGRWPSRDAVT